MMMQFKTLFAIALEVIAAHLFALRFLINDFGNAGNSDLCCRFIRQVN